MSFLFVLFLAPGIQGIPWQNPSGTQAKRRERSVSTYDKKYSLCKNSLEKSQTDNCSLHKKRQQTCIKGWNLIPRVTHYNSQMSSMQQQQKKSQDMHKKIHKKK